MSRNGRSPRGKKNVAHKNADLEVTQIEDQVLEPPIDLSTLKKGEIRELQQHKMYQDITHDFDVQQVIEQWFGSFDDLEESDVWKALTVAERGFFLKVKENKDKGKKQYIDLDIGLRAFDDVTDPENHNYIVRQLKLLSDPQPMLSDKTFSSGSGNYESEAEKINMSDDEDLERLKLLTQERATKQQLQLDLNRIKKKEQGGTRSKYRQNRSSDEDSEKNIKIEKEEQKDYLREETLAQHAVLETGNLDLYKRAQQLNEKQAQSILAYKHNPSQLNSNKCSGIDEESEFSDKKFSKRRPKNEKQFDEEQSYFSDDTDQVENDTVKSWLKEIREMRGNKGSFLDPLESKLMNSGFETRETKKALKLNLKDPVKTKLTAKFYNAKNIAQQMKKAGMTSKNELEIQVMANEMAKLEREQEQEVFIVNQLNNKTEDGKDKYTEKNRLFAKNPDQGKLYTNRYVRRLKVTHQKLMDKFTLGSKYALTAQRKQLMARATRLVVESHNQLLQNFQQEALTLLYQTNQFKLELDKRQKQVEMLLDRNRSLEIDLSVILKQNDYLEARVPEIMKKFTGYQLQPIGWSDRDDNQVAHANQYIDQCNLPEQSSDLPPSCKFDWQKISIDDRCDRADLRVHINCDLESMEPNMTKHAFDFYGSYVRISEAQKYKYAENRVVSYYKDLVHELLTSNESLRLEVASMININKKYEFNEEEVRQAIASEQAKREVLEDDMAQQKVRYEARIEEILNKRMESQLDLTEFYNKKIEFLQTELKTSAAIREIQDKNNTKLKSEIATLAKIVKTSRHHYKELEKCDLEALNKQLEKYETQVAALKVSESQVQTILAAKAQKRHNESQRKADRIEFNAEAKKHRYSQIKIPIEEKLPKQVLKDLIEIRRPRKIHEKIPGPDRGTSIEDVMADMKIQALSTTRAALTVRNSKMVDQGATLNEDSLTESSVEKPAKQEIFQTMPPIEVTDAESVPSKAQNKRSDVSTGMALRIRVRKANHNSEIDGLDGFTLSQQEIESDRGLLLETATEDINKYLLDQLQHSNQDLIMHDQILISEYGQSNFEEAGRIQLASQTNSIKSQRQMAEQHAKQRSRTTLKHFNQSKLTATNEITIEQESNNSPTPKRKLNYLDQIIDKKMQSRNPTPTVTVQDNRVTYTQDSSRPKDRSPSMTLGPTTPNSGRVKNFSMNSENFRHDQSMRLQTANQIVGMPRRDPLRHKVIPQLQGVIGGDNAQQNLVALDNLVPNVKAGRNATPSKLPKISDIHFNTKISNRRAASIPPRTAAAATVSALVSPTNQQVLQSLVNNATFLGRGRFSTNNRNQSSIPSSPTNLPVSPPSIQVQGKANPLCQQQQVRNSKVQVRLPGASSKKFNHRQNSFVEGYDHITASVYQLQHRSPQIETLRSKVNKKDTEMFNQMVSMEINGQMMLDDAIYSMIKLNLPSSAGVADENHTKSKELVTEPSQILTDRGSEAQIAEKRWNHHDSRVTQMVESHRQSVIGENTKIPIFSALVSKKSERVKQMPSNLMNLTAQIDSSEQSPDTIRESQGLLKTRLNTIQIQSDPFEPSRTSKDKPLNHSLSPRKATMVVQKKRGLQPLKKRSPKMVSPNKKQERESREQKQKKLKKQLDTALDKTTEKLNKSKDQN